MYRIQILSKIFSFIESSGSKSFAFPKIFFSTFSPSLAGYSAGFLCNPFDVVKTNYQTRKSVTIKGIIQTIFKEAGWRGFFQGAYARASSMAITSTLMSILYEELKRISLKT